MVLEDLFDDTIGRVSFRGDAEMDCYLVSQVVLLECRGQTLVQVRLEAFAGANDRDVRDIVLRCEGED